MKSLRNKLRLKHLIVGVIGLAFLLAIVSSMFSSYKGNVKLLEKQSLETNRVYAEKLAQMVDIFLSDSMGKLKAASENIADSMDNQAFLLKEVDRIQRENQTFNSVIIADKEGNILAGAPKETGLTGKKIKSKEGLQLIKNQKPDISDPYRAATGRMLITISHPIFKDGKYLGLINGTIYIHDSNILQSILGEHTYKDGSYVYVVDSKGVIIYHQNPERIGDDVSANKVVQRLINGESGSQRVINTLGVDMLAGFSTINSANWGVVAQTPYEVAIKPVGKEVRNMLFIELPLMFFSLILVLFISAKIVLPLQKIAEIAENSTDEKELNKLKQLHVWFYEASQIKNSLLQSLSFLHGQVSHFKDQMTIDPLTQLLNRRSLDQILQTWSNQGRQFSIILLDIDNFKNVNDTFGHSVGDEVLKFLAEQMKNSIREHDICCRFGGEEFVILLPETTNKQAYEMAERFRLKMEKIISPCGRSITFSAGIASFPEAGDLSTLIEAADEALYKAKRAGRNRVEIAELSKTIS